LSEVISFFYIKLNYKDYKEVLIMIKKTSKKNTTLRTTTPYTAS